VLNGKNHPIDAVTLAEFIDVFAVRAVEPTQIDRRSLNNRMADGNLGHANKSRAIDNLMALQPGPIQCGSFFWKQLDLMIRLIFSSFELYAFGGQ
jgi:hypothetical protein